MVRNVTQSANAFPLASLTAFNRSGIGSGTGIGGGVSQPEQAGPTASSVRRHPPIPSTKSPASKLPLGRNVLVSAELAAAAGLRCLAAQPVCRPRNVVVRQGAESLQRADINDAW